MKHTKFSCIVEGEGEEAIEAFRSINEKQFGFFETFKDLEGSIGEYFTSEPYSKEGFSKYMQETIRLRTVQILDEFILPLTPENINRICYQIKKYLETK